MFKKLKLIVTRDELEKASFLLGVGGGWFKLLVTLMLKVDR